MDTKPNAMATAMLGIFLITIGIVGGQGFFDNNTIWETYSDNLTYWNATTSSNETAYNETYLIELRHISRMEKAKEWGDPGSYAILIISEAGQTLASEAITILAEYLMQKRGDELSLFHVELHPSINETAEVAAEICNQLRNARRTRSMPQDTTGVLINAIIDTTESPALSGVVAKALKHVDIPTFATMSTTAPRTAGRGRINFSSLADYMALSVRSVLFREKISTAALYYDRRFDIERIRAPIDALSFSLALTNATTRHSIRELLAATPAQANAQLRRAEWDNVFNWFLFTDFRTASTFLVEAERLGRTRPAKFSWFVISTDYYVTGDTTFECAECKEARVNVFRPVPDAGQEKEAENVLKRFAAAAAAVASSSSSNSSVDINVGFDGPLAKWSSSKHLNASMSTRILFYYDMLSASVKIIKRLVTVDEMEPVDIVAVMCNPKKDVMIEVPIIFEVFGNSSTNKKQNSTTTRQQKQDQTLPLPFDLTAALSATEHAGVFGLVSLGKLIIKNPKDSSIESAKMSEVVSSGVVYVQARVQLTQYNFKDTQELGHVGKANVRNQTPHDVNNFADTNVEIAPIERVIPWGNWTLADGLKLDAAAPPYYMSRKLYNVTFMEIKPWIFKNDTGWSGFIADVMMEMSIALGFDYNMHLPPPENVPGTYYPDSGKWDGMMRELVDGRAHIAIGPMPVTAEREDFIDFTVPIFDLNGLSILVKKNKDVPSMFKFVGVFGGQVWSGCGVTFIFVSIMIFIFDFFSPYSQRNILRRRQGKSIFPGPNILHLLRRRGRRRSRHHHRRMLGNLFKKFTAEVASVGAMKQKVKEIELATITQAVVPVHDMTSENKEEEKEEEVDPAKTLSYGSRVFTVKESFWFTVASLTPQGGGEAPRNLSGRLVATSWWMFVFIIVASYTANLAAFLTVNRLDSPIRTLEDLMRQNGMRFAPHADSEVEEYFRRVALIEDKFYDIWSKLVLNESLSERERLMYSTYEYPISDKFTNLYLTFSANEKPPTFWEGVQWVKDSISDRDGFALIADESMIRYAVAHDENCDIKIIGGEWSRKPYSIAVQEDSPLKEELSGAILDLLNDRVLEMHKESWWMELNTKCYNTETADILAKDQGISIQNVGGVFVVVATGTIIACTMLVLEFYWFRLRTTAQASILATSKVARILDKMFGGLNEAIAARIREESGQQNPIRNIYNNKDV